MNATQFLITLVLSVAAGVAGLTFAAMLAARLRHAAKATATDGKATEKQPAEQSAAAGTFTLTGSPDLGALRMATNRQLSDQVGRLRCALLLIALVNIDAINRVFNPAYGDQVLRQSAERLQELARSGDVVARVSSDRFGVLITDLPVSDSGMARAEQLFRGLRALRVGPQHIPVNARCGLARARQELPEDFDLLYGRADYALARAQVFGVDVGAAE